MSLEKKRPKEKSVLSRRVFLGGLAAAGLAAVGQYGRLREEHEANPEQVPAPDSSELDTRLAFFHVKQDPRPYSTPKLAGKKCGYPMNAYFGHDRTEAYRAVTEADFKYQLAALWCGKARKLGLTAAHVGDPRLALMNKLVMEYDPDGAGVTNIREYFRSMHNAIGRARNEINWKKLQSHFALDAKQTDFVRVAAEEIDAQTLLSLSLTEIMHSKDPFVIDVYDTLLQTAGSQFVERIPSDGDALISFGPYQLTEQLFTVTKNGAKQHGSVFQMSHVLNHRILPNDIVDLEGAQHHSATYLNAVNNLVRLARRLGPEKAALLTRAKITDDIREFVTAAHNHPGAALSAFERFSGAYTVVAQHHGNAQPHFQAFAAEPIKTYVERANGHFAEIRQRAAFALARF